MNCLKAINLLRDYGKLRLWLLSSLFSLTYFIVYFMTFHMFQPETMYTQIGFIPVLLLSLVVTPVHAFLHCLPIWLCGQKASIFTVTPFTYYCRIPKVLSRRVALIAVSCPFLLITITSLTGPLFFPNYLHLFAIVSTLNIFLCVKDMIYIKHLWLAPKDSYLEDGITGFQIIVRRTY